MASIVYIAAKGSRSVVQVPAGTSLMMGAVLPNVRGIDGECGGCLSFATCHIDLDPEWAERMPPAESKEVKMLESVVAERRPTSRLGCQIHRADGRNR